MRSSPTLIFVVALILVAPAAAATHWTLYYQGVDRSVGTTTENDRVVYSVGGDPYEGIANKVNRDFTSIGDGTLFLDARVGSHAGSSVSGFGVSSTGIGVYPSNAGSVIGRPDILPPGLHEVSAWYGHWNDLDANGVIDDVRDAEASPADEFIWRGLGSGDATTLVLYHDGDASKFADGTARERVEQSWIAEYNHYFAEPFLSSTYTMVIAGARPLTNSLGVDITDPAALIDVDLYSAVSPDVELLWDLAVDDSSATVAEVVFPLVFIVLDATLDAVDNSDPVGLAFTALGIFGDTVTRPVLNIVDDAIAQSDTEGALEGAVGSLAGFVQETRLPHSKEPNTVEDDYEGRALYGGVGDALGSHNTYDGYASNFHLYMDATPITRYCAGVYVSVPGTGTEASPFAGCLPLLDLDVDYVGPALHFAQNEPPNERHGTNMLMTFDARVLLWKDVNRDTHVGWSCNRDDPESFDEERNTCRSANEPWPGSDLTDNAERFNVCDSTTAKGGTITLTPVGGPWPSVVFIKDYAETTRATFELRTDSAPITLRWKDVCHTIPPDLVSRDAILFPRGGTNVSIRVETSAVIDGFGDAEAGILVGREHVIDVDVLPANL